MRNRSRRATLPGQGRNEVHRARCRDHLLASLRSLAQHAFEGLDQQSGLGRVQHSLVIAAEVMQGTPGVAEIAPVGHDRSSELGMFAQGNEDGHFALNCPRSVGMIGSQVRTVEMVEPILVAQLHQHFPAAQRRPQQRFRLRLGDGRLIALGRMACHGPRQARREQVQRTRWQAARFVEGIKPVRDHSRMPVFQEMFAYLHRPSGVLPLNCLLIFHELRLETSTFDLTLSIRGSYSTAGVWLESDSELCEQGTAEGLLAQSHATLLAAALCQPEERLFMGAPAASQSIQRRLREGERLTTRRVPCRSAKNRCRC